MFRPFAVATALILAPKAIAADTPATIGFLDTGKVQCLMRVYDAAHLKAHPKQQVSEIALLAGEGEVITTADGKLMLPVKVSARLKSLKPVIANSAVCFAATKAGEMTCEMEGDGGVFTLVKQADGKVLLRNGDDIVLINEEAADPEQEFVQIKAADDHESFLLSTGEGGLCAAAAP